MATQNLEATEVVAVVDVLRPFKKLLGPTVIGDASGGGGTTADFSIVAYAPLNAPSVTIAKTSTTLDFNIDTTVGVVTVADLRITLDGATIWNGSTFAADFSGSSFTAGAGVSQDLSLVKGTNWTPGTTFELQIFSV